MAEEAPLLNDEADHPHDVVFERNGRRIIAMDSARYVDGRNRGTDVVVPSSYLGVLPARMMAPHAPRAVIAHDGCIGKDGAGIAGLWYLEALGIPAAAADGMSAELGNGLDLYETGSISRVNILAERSGVTEGMSVREAAERLLMNEPGRCLGSTGNTLCPRSHVLGFCAFRTYAHDDQSIRDSEYRRLWRCTGDVSVARKESRSRRSTAEEERRDEQSMVKQKISLGRTHHHGLFSGFGATRAGDGR